MPRSPRSLPAPGRRALRGAISLVALVSLVALASLAAPRASAQAVAKTQRGAATPAQLPPHRVASVTSLAPRAGKRVEIHVRDTRLTKAQCAALIEAYRSRGAPDGQVSVRKPAKSLDGQLFPFCVENFDGRGVQYNDFAF